MRVLVVDDSPIVRRRVAALVADLPHVGAVFEAEDAHAARALFLRTAPDAVILDLSLPGGSGLEILKWIRACHTAPLVVVLTAHGEDSYRRSCLEAGADFFFDKATEFDRVREALLPTSARPAARPSPPR
jgi:DNA-binding NarL/FixJ family response regulator